MFKTISLWVAIALLVAIATIYSGGLSLSMLSSDHSVHSHSPSYAGNGTKSTLENGDTLNCVRKTFPGYFTSKSRSFNNGNITDVVRADTYGEYNCHYTGVNNGAHEAGVDPYAEGGNTFWQDKSDHGT